MGPTQGTAEEDLKSLRLARGGGASTGSSAVPPLGPVGGWSW